MANLNIAGSGNNVELLLEEFEWEALAVNGDGVPGFTVPGSKGKRFFFAGEAPFEFMASSRRAITITSPSQSFFMKGGPKSDIVYFLSVDYFPASDGFTINGMVDVTKGKDPDGQNAPIEFSQDTMKGQMILANKGK